MSSFRRIQNGYLIAPRRGVIPTPPEGYEVAHGDPYVFLPKLPECSLREKRLIKRSCCGTTERLYCKNREEFTTRLNCQECKNA